MHQKALSVLLPVSGNEALTQSLSLLQLATKLSAPSQSVARKEEAACSVQEQLKDKEALEGANAAMHAQTADNDAQASTLVLTSGPVLWRGDKTYASHQQVPPCLAFAGTIAARPCQGNTGHTPSPDQPCYGAIQCTSATGC